MPPIDIFFTYIARPLTQIPPENEGKLVLVRGTLDVSPAAISDPLFDVSASALRLTRLVEMHQWERVLVDTADDDDTYDYETRWSSETLSSNYGSEHKDPGQKPLDNLTISNEASIGEFRAADYHITQMQVEETQFTNLNPDDAAVHGLFVSVNDQLETDSESEYYEVGDVRITFTYVPVDAITDVTILSMQSNGSFTPFICRDGRTLDEIWLADMDKTAVVEALGSDSTTAKIAAVCLTLVFGAIGALLTVRKAKRA